MLGSAPAAAQTVPPEADRTLWCASAFYWLAGSASDSGEEAEAEQYDGWSTQLLESGSAALIAAGFAPDKIEELIADYDAAALAQLADGSATYDVTGCPELLTPVQ